MCVCVGPGEGASVWLVMVRFRFTEDSSFQLDKTSQDPHWSALVRIFSHCSISAQREGGSTLREAFGGQALGYHDEGGSVSSASVIIRQMSEKGGLSSGC